MSKLYIVATPIGNLSDMTFRAVDTLKQVDVIAAEDTRSAKKLLTHYQIEAKKLISYHQVNEDKISDKIIDFLDQGITVAIISEAGTPCISDPGYLVTRKAAEKEHEIIPIPGPSASIAALSVSGLTSDRFLFLGFLPVKKGKQKKILEYYRDIDTSLVVYESPFRVIKTLKLFFELFGNCDVYIGRELTKLYEESLRGPLQEVLRELEQRNKLKGEFVIILNLKKE